MFEGATFGLAHLAGPTGGYLVGFVAAAAVVGWCADRGWLGGPASAAASLLAGEIAIYAFGLLWLSRFPLAVGVLDAGLLPFIAGDLYKIALALAVLPPVARRFGTR